jgi:hypothetical protein
LKAGGLEIMIVKHFEIHWPNHETEKAIDEVDEGT